MSCYHVMKPLANGRPNCCFDAIKDVMKVSY